MRDPDGRRSSTRAPLSRAPSPHSRTAEHESTTACTGHIVGDGPALVPAGRIDRARCPKRRRSARAACSATPKAHRKHTEAHRKHRVIAWFLGDAQATGALIPSVLDTSGPRRGTAQSRGSVAQSGGGSPTSDAQPLRPTETPAPPVLAVRCLGCDQQRGPNDRPSFILAPRRGPTRSDRRHRGSAPPVPDRR